MYALNVRYPLRGYCCIGLYHPKCAANVGGCLRAAYVYGASLIAISGHRYSQHSTNTTKTERHVPMLQVENLKDVIPYGCVPVAVDLIDGAKPLPNYMHPVRAYYIFGPEDGTLGKSVLDWCRDIVYIPTRYCMNLAACVNVVLYDRMCKNLRHNLSANLL